MLLNDLILHIFMNYEAQNRDKRLNYKTKILDHVFQKVENKIRFIYWLRLYGDFNGKAYIRRIQL